MNREAVSLGATKEYEAVELCTYSLMSSSAIVYRASWRTKVDMFNSRYFSSGPAVHGELGRRFDSSCHGLKTKKNSFHL